MEPLTVIATVASKHGIALVAKALAGDGGGDLATKLVEALLASEDRLAERLEGIERKLDEVLEQRYAITIGSGLRTLVDAATATDPRVRADELIRARDLFREAVAAARSPLHIAVAERYLVLCGLALGRQDTAHTALRKLQLAATEALLGAGMNGTHAAALAQANQKLGRGQRWDDIVDKKSHPILVDIQHGATETSELAGRLLGEAGALAEALGHGTPSELRWLPAGELVKKTWSSPSRWDVGRWEVRPTEAGTTRVGTLTVDWYEKRQWYELPLPFASGHAHGGAGPGLARQDTTMTDLAWVGRPGLDIVVRSDPPLTEPAEVRLQYAPTPGDPSTVTIGNALVFPAPSGKQ